MVLIDLSKAFYRICHLTLPLKLQGLGAYSKASKWFESYLTERMQSPRLGTSRSEELIVTHSVPQGPILGPLLLSLYMNDLPSVVKFSSVESYADYTKVYLSISSKDIDSCLTEVTEGLRLITVWCCTNKLLINPSKTKLILFGIRQLIVSKILDVRVPFLGQNLAPVPLVKDLGIILNSNLTSNEHVNTMTSFFISTLCQTSKVRHLFSKSLLVTILSCLVFSKLFHCSTVWSGTFEQNIHKLQLRKNFAARVLTNTRKFDHISPILRELGWFSIKHLLLVRDVTQLYQIANGFAPSYLNSYIYKRTGILSYNTRFRENLGVLLCRTATAQRSFPYRSINNWNSQRASTRNNKTLTSFKRGAKLELCHTENQVTDCMTTTVFICPNRVLLEY